jgi:hypothetical protein
MVDKCGICQLSNLEDVESAAAPMLTDDHPGVSWSGLEREFGVNRQSLRTHMLKHYTPPASATESALEGLDEAIALNIEELQSQMALAPPEIKPFYAIAIQNLRGIGETKASQQNLIQALKAIHEVTGMKMEQRMMLEFARHAFPAAVTPAGELADPEIVDAEVVDG